jgi:cysteine desulfurase
MSNQFIYLDYNATTPLDDRVFDAMVPYFKDHYANPGSTHLFGLTVREAVDEAIENLAEVIGGRSNDILFTSGATEAINLALKGFTFSERKHIVTISTEHKAVLDTCSFLESNGYSVTYIPVDSSGMINTEMLSSMVTDQTLLVSVMLVNNETGVILPIKEISEIAHRKGALMLCDGTQAVGKMPVGVKDLDVDFFAFSAHKFYGPKGVGGLYLSNNAKKILTPQIHGGKQQRGLRSGTLNVPGIIGMGKAASLSASEMSADCIRIKGLRDLLEEGLLTISDSFVNGHSEHRLYNTTNLSFPGVQSEKLIVNLGSIAVSSGSACSATITKPSHVLEAMGLSDADSLSALRFSLGKFTTLEEVEKTIDVMKITVDRLRNNQFA